MITERTKALLSRSRYASIKLTVRDVVMLDCITNGKTMLRKWNLLPDFKCGVIGSPGSGKSLSAGLICLRDHMMCGETCWSNLFIKATLPITEKVEKVIKEYEDFTGQVIKREPVIYQSEQLDPALFLSENPPYRNGVVCVDEVNIEIADAYRATMNQSLAASDTIQLFRKMRSALYVTCISETYMPPRLRENIDSYIRTRDFAFINTSERYGQPQGNDIQWSMFNITERYAGVDNRYPQLKDPFFTATIDSHSMWGIVDTWERKKRRKYVHALFDRSQEGNAEAGLDNLADDAEVEISQSATVEDEKDTWGWLLYHPFVQKMKADGKEVSGRDLLDRLFPDKPESLRVSGEEVLEYFATRLNPMKRRRQSGYFYQFDRFTSDFLDDPPTHTNQLAGAIP